jgi:hypothetical protein
MYSIRETHWTLFTPYLPTQVECKHDQTKKVKSPGVKTPLVPSLCVAMCGKKAHDRINVMSTMVVLRRASLAVVILESRVAIDTQPSTDSSVCTQQSAIATNTTERGKTNL